MASFLFSAYGQEYCSRTEWCWPYIFVRLFTGYTRPIEHMERLGAKVDQADRDRLTDARGGRLAPVEEREAVIAFMGEDRQAHFIHFQHGMGQYAEFTRNCVTKPETMLDVSAK